MDERTVANRARLAGLILSSSAKTVWHGSLRPIRRLSAGRGAVPIRLLIAPQDIRTADPTVAADIYAGYFVFDGKTVNAHGRSPFGIDPPSEGWAEALAGFGWLRHLRAADTALARVNARALVNDWISHAARSRRGPEWAPRIVAERLLAWLSQSPLILDGADGVFYRRFMRSIGRQALSLEQALAGGLEGEARLFAAIALVEVGVCAEGLERLRRQAIRQLIQELGRQILIDGGHVGRNPSALADLLLDLLPLRQTFVAAGIAVPPALLNAVDRMIPMLRTFRHGDGSLALFNGMSMTRHDTLATILAHDDIRGAPLANAPYAGYQRLETDRLTVVMDTGRPPPREFAGQAHAGTLSFELSIGQQRVVVNCGAPPAGPGDLRDAARSTAAHSTLTIGGQSSALVARQTGLRRGVGGVLYAGPVHVPVQRSEFDEAVEVQASHDGYRRRYGALHHRRLRLSEAGRLEGEDRVSRPGAARREPTPVDVTLRFHLHYAVRTQLVRDGTVVVLALPDGELWQFEAGGLVLDIQESVFFAGSHGPRRIEQIVIVGTLEDSFRVTWSIAPRQDD